MSDAGSPRANVPGEVGSRRSWQAGKIRLPAHASSGRPTFRERVMLKAVGWIIAIIFIIGLLVVFGVIDLVF